MRKLRPKEADVGAGGVQDLRFPVPVRVQGRRTLLVQERMGGRVSRFLTICQPPGDDNEACLR